MLVWLSLDAWLITLISIAYLALLFVVAYWGQNKAKKQWFSKPWIYSLSLGASCTTWAFYGTVGQAATTGAWIAPIYIGSILCLLLAWPMLLRILQIIKQQNLTSIADFIACRYDRSPKVAATVAIIALIGTIPYIALQLRAIGNSFDLLTGNYQTGISTTFIVTLVLIVFSIFFGTRQLAASKQNQGLVLAIAFSSIVKLFALTAVGIFATFFIFNGFEDLFNQHSQMQSNAEIVNGSSIYLSISQAVLGAITIFILPQQFHLMMIENHTERQLKSGRWLFSGYLILINLFVLPIALAGQITFPGGSVDADTYVLTIPLFYQQAWLGGVVYIGGLAAATSMVIVSAIVLSTMISTEVINPITLRFRLFNSKQTEQLSGLIINQRRFAIATILLLAFAFERSINQQNHLAAIGLLSFVLLSQVAPATIGALYWRKATTKAALISLIVGSTVWLYTLLLPTIFPESNWVNHGPLSIDWLKPTALFGLSFLDSTSHGVFYTLILNIISYISISMVTHRSVGEKLQAEVFVNKSQSQFERNLSTDDLYNLLQRFINKSAAQNLSQYRSNNPGLNNEDLVEYTRLQLSGVLGSASTSMVMKAASSRQEMPLEDVVSIVDEASQMFEFNRELLQSGVENIEQGISVVDADMRLVAWNNRYIELLEYPQHVIKAGMPVEQLLQLSIDKGVIVGNEAEQLIKTRLEHMRSGSSHHFQRVMPSGIVLEIRGQAMPGGGFVSTFADITAHIEAEKALQQANQTLEKRVENRTAELLNAKAEAEAANSSKTRFLAAASHDLMQPFNALTLFTSMLKKKVQGDELRLLANQIGDSLNVVETLLSDLVEISRLDSSPQKLSESNFAIDELLTPLKNEFSALAEQANINFNYQPCSGFVKSDKRMLRRILQNFLSNAVHYCGQREGVKSRILLGVRRRTHHLSIEVWDNGPGIPTDKQQSIFEEFERLEQNRDIPGLGLGLAISKRMAVMLGIIITVKSVVGKGTGFIIDLPKAEADEDLMPDHNIIAIDSSPKSFNGTSVLLIDNDSLTLSAMSSLLTDWGCQVITARDEISMFSQLEESSIIPQLVLGDYHLDDNANGVDLIAKLFKQQQWQIPCVICSADPSEQVRQHTSDAQFYFLRKPVKELALKRLMKQLIFAID
ncbi:PAS domain-containing hybrid sensor histidine kinase/response regulator [Thalassotalea nanhaiensis]|uniref:histidine kinase n=1 Tax=Thalassotalea nanhaiensis TaxID=3065648 RepID=A0ABY9TJZ0_9GAMM|nr:PAS domain-containing hybrid sensor histidine kinase/response regulator [Colwelliaceae bacterium SQ345]